MMNIDKLVKQAQKMQAQIVLARAQLEKAIVEGTSGGGMVKVEANGQGDVLSVSISKEVVDPEDVDMLEDLVLAAVKDAISKSRATAGSKMSTVTGGMGGFPGLM